MFLKCKQWCLPLGLAPWSLTDQNQDRQICGVTPPSSPVPVLRFTLPLSSPLTRGLATILFHVQLSLISSTLTCGTGRLKPNIRPLKMIQALGRGISHLLTETPVRNNLVTFVLLAHPSSHRKLLSPIIHTQKLHYSPKFMKMPRSFNDYPQYLTT